MTNWIEEATNRFKAPKPPAWFLKALWDQDAMLVILPSRVRQAYVLARRRDKTYANAPMMVAAHNDLLRKTRGGDGDLLATHNLLMVDYIVGNIHGTWSPAIIADLKSRDTWAAGGGDKHADKLDEADRKAAEKRRTDLSSDMEHRARDAWRSLQARTGQRNQHANEGHKKPAVRVG